MPFYRSVVGKLWATIIGMVAVVLTLLTLLLGQFLESYYFREESSSLMDLAERLTHVFETYPDIQAAVNTTGHLLEAYHTNMIVDGVAEGSYLYATGENAAITSFHTDPSIPELNINEFFTSEEWEMVQKGRAITVQRGIVSENQTVNNVLAGVVPLHNEMGEVVGSVVLYQSLKDLQETTDGAKRYILYAAGIAIVMTTFFAFFLSTRITSPVIQMKKAADQMSHGSFSVRVPIRTTDEIGELARTFNRMAEDLEQTISDLHHEKEQLSSILRSMVDGVLTVNREGEILLTNPPVRQMLYMLNQSHETGNNRLPKTLPAPLVPIYKRVLEELEVQSGDVSASGRTWSVAMAPLYAEQENVLRGVVAVLRDVTEERKLDKLRNDFVANISHELRTPISMMQGYSEAILDGVVSTEEEVRALVSIIHDESVRMGSLVNELLDLARMESGHLQLQMKRVNLAALSENVLNKFAEMAKESGVTLRRVLHNEIPVIEADPDRLQQVLINLVDNALRHTPSGGEIAIEIEKLQEAVLLEVKDNGVGIPAEDLPFVFERFYKVDKARTRKRSGMGLGLAIAKNIIETHGGMISVTSEEGKGTTFSLILPIKQTGKKA